MNSLEFIEKEIEATKRSYKAFELDYELFHRESDNRDAEELMKKLIHLQQIKTELEVLKILKPQLDLEYEDGEDDKFMIGMRHYVGLETKQVELVKEVLFYE